MPDDNKTSANMAKLRELQTKRSSIKGQITKFRHYLNSMSLEAELTDIQLIELKLKLAKFETLSVKFDDLQNEIEVLNPDNVSAEVDERDNIEQDVVVNIATAQTLVEKFSKTFECEHRRNSVIGNSCCADPPDVGLKLPQIQISKFDGSYFRWLEFKDSFESLIHNNLRITPIQKFHYLISYLEGDAARIISNLEVSSANYCEAWKLLCGRYNNKRLLINHHLNSLFTIKPLPLESERSLRFLVDQVTKNLRALAGLGQPTDKWDVLIIFMLCSKLDSNTLMKWEEFRNNIEGDVPTLEQFFKFLIDRADVLESMSRNKRDINLSKPIQSSMNRHQPGVSNQHQKQGGVRRTTTQSSINATRDSHLLSVLAARRKQLKGGQSSVFSALPALAQAAKKGNTTYAKIEIRDANNVTIKRLTFEASPLHKILTTDSTKDRQDIRPHEIRHIFMPKVYQDNRNRAGLVEGRRKDSPNVNKTNATFEQATESGIVYVPPEKLEGLDREVDLDPEEEFQVDESNHGLYLLNYSDTENNTQSPILNKTTISNEIKENSTFLIENTSPTVNVTTESVTTQILPKENIEEKPEINAIANSTDTNTKLVKVENEKEKENHTLFMSDEIYNHFRPLESELAVEDMAPFLNFGQKLGGQVSDNLTNSPSLSASTKSVNFIAAPLEKRKIFNSRYSATEKYKNTSVDEEEINEDMDVSVVKNIIEKNKIRNSVKGTAPARHVGLVNAYRKYPSSTPATTKSLNIAQLNVTEPILFNVTPNTLDRTKESNQTNNITSSVKETVNKTNGTQIVKDNFQNKTNITATPRNYTRSYFNLRRRPARVTVSSTTETIVPTTANSTTEKLATSVYTAVVTSVLITSSMKGHNKTDDIEKESDNSTVVEDLETETVKNITTEKPILLNDTDATVIVSSTIRPYRHRIRIRTTTTESSVSSSTYPTLLVYKTSDVPLTSEYPTTSRITERLASLLRQNVYETIGNGSTVRPKNILRRRRPTTTTTTSTPSTAITPTITTVSTSSLPVTIFSEKSTATTQMTSPIFSTIQNLETTERTTFKPFIVTSKTSSQSKSKPIVLSTSSPNDANNITVVNNTKDSREEDPTSENVEVVIEAEKSYTASYVLAGLGFLPVAGIIAFVLRNVLNKKTKEIDTEYEGYFDDGEIKKESPITPVARPPLPTPSKPDQKWEFPRNKLRLQTLLGQGNFGQVWKAEADDLNGHDGLTRLVAVKTIKETASQKEKQELLHEIYIMQKIVTHPNVVTLLACCTEQEPYLLIMEYVMCGKLLTYLRERRSRPDRFSGSGALTSRDLTVFAYCVARGMDYIASKGIVHRDLAARNVLVDHNKLCKIADFGMSRCAGASARAARSALPVRWMAPEALLYNVYSHHTDVWAFGILLWEIVTLGSTPYAAMSGREVLAAVTEGYRLERPPHCKPQLYRAMHSCWHADPSQRPSFADLKAQLAELLDNEPSEGNYVDLDSFYQESSVYSDPSAIINDDEGLSAEYDRERRVFRDLGNKGPTKFDNRAFSFRDEELRNKFGVGTPRMGGFGIRDVPFDRNFSDGEFNERTFTDNFNDTNFTERKDGKLSTSSFHRERERENPLVSRNSFNGFPRIGTRDGHFQMTPDGRNKRVSEFECDI